MEAQREGKDRHVLRYSQRMDESSRALRPAGAKAVAGGKAHLPHSALSLTLLCTSLTRRNRTQRNPVTVPSPHETTGREWFLSEAVIAWKK
jgi:hypothetical protein